jgi:nodulation protein E
MKPRRVVVSGIGVVSALGDERETFWSALAAGRSGVGPMTMADPSDFHFKNAAEAKNFDPIGVLGSKLAKQTDRFTQFALVAAIRAVADSGIDRAKLQSHRAGVIAGTIVGGQDTQDASFSALYRQGHSRVHPATIVKIMPNAAVSQVSILLGITGPSYTVSAACSSSNFAIGQAFWLVRGGVLDVALTGGTDAPFSFGNLKAWDSMRVVSPDICRPFSVNRDGMVLGEGGGILVLETAESAQRRGAHIYAEIVGFGMSSDASHIVHPSVEGAALTMEAALEDAGLEARSVDYINAHGTGTVVNDASETAAIRKVFGEHTGKLAVSSTKSMHGHTLGAAGALEAIATALAIDRKLIPPTVNYQGRDEACDLDVVPNEARRSAIKVALSNSFAFGGLNAVLAFREWSESP